MLWTWLSENLALANGVAVPLLLGILKPILERETGGRSVRRLKQHAAILGALPQGSRAAEKMDEIVAAELERYKARLGRKADGGTLAAMVIVALLGGALSFGLVTWAQHATGGGAVVLWIITAIWSLFVLLLVFVGGGPTLYQTAEEKAQNAAKRAERKAERKKRKALRAAAPQR